MLDTWTTGHSVRMSWGTEDNAKKSIHPFKYIVKKVDIGGSWVEVQGRRTEVFWNYHMWYLIKIQSASLMWLTLLIALKYYSLHAVSLTRTLICINFSACFILIECAFYSHCHAFLDNERDGGQAHTIPFPYGSLYQVESLQTMIICHDKSFPSFILAHGIQWYFLTCWKCFHLEGGKMNKLQCSL